MQKSVNSGIVGRLLLEENTLEQATGNYTDGLGLGPCLFKGKENKEKNLNQDQPLTRK